jgi:nucleotide-binding universal stress UspA family protein
LYKATFYQARSSLICSPEYQAWGNTYLSFLDVASNYLTTPKCDQPHLLPCRLSSSIKISYDIFVLHRSIGANHSMKKISAVFDGLKFAHSTLSYAIKLAESSKALLSGVFLEPFLYNSYRLGDMIGPNGISQAKLNRLIEQDKQTRAKSADVFEQACKNVHISYTIHRDPGFSIPEVLKESIYSDLLLVNAAEAFNNTKSEQPTYFVRELLSGTQCPVLIIPSAYREIEKVVLLYDGKPASVYAIKMFNYMMPWLSDKQVEVVSVTDSQNTANLPDEALVKEFIACQYPNAIYTLLNGDAEKELTAYLKNSSKSSIVVLGAYQRGDVSRWFKSSMADHLMKEVDMPLFIAHH